MLLATVAFLVECRTESSLTPDRLCVFLQSVSYAIGQASAFSYCLSIDSSVFKVGTEVLYFARDACVLADKEETSLFQRLQVGRNLTLEAVVKLRVACMEMLCALMGWEAFKESTEANVSLTCSSVRNTSLDTIMLAVLSSY